MTFLLTGFREQEVVHLSWNDIHFRRIRVTAKPDLRFSRSEGPSERLIELLKVHPQDGSRFVFPSPRGNRLPHMWYSARRNPNRPNCPPTFSSKISYTSPNAHM